MAKFFFLALFSLFLCLLPLFGEETVESCRAACRARYQAYYEDCRVAFPRSYPEVTDYESCVAMVQERIAVCGAECGEL